MTPTTAPTPIYKAAIIVEKKLINTYYTAFLLLSFSSICVVNSLGGSARRASKFYTQLMK